MKSLLKVASVAIILLVVFACSSTLHLYPGQQYLSDEELGTLFVSDQIQIYKFDRKEVYKTPKPPIIKALPGEHRLDITIFVAVDQPKESTIYWNAIEGCTYQLTLSETDDATIVEIASN